MSARGTWLLLVLAGTLWGPAGARADKPTADEIKQLVGQLGGGNAAAAKKRLAEAGPAALAALREVIAQNKDARKAAAEVVEQIGQDVQKNLVEATLAKLQSKGAVVRRLPDDSLAQLFPSFLIYSVRYPQHPTPVRPRAPLKVHNIFTVDKDGQLDHLTDFEGRVAFFRNHLPVRIMKVELEKQVARAWLALAQEFAQDGFLTFTVPENEIKAGRTVGGRKVVARAVIKPEGGNKGFIQATVTFGLTGFFDDVMEDKTITRGKRPR